MCIRDSPYRVYGTQQDNSSVCVPSDTIAGPITWGDCEVVGTGESGYIAVKPDDVNTVYVGAVGSSPGGQGSLQKADRRTGQIQLVNVWPEDLHGRGVGEAQVRFPWTFPILFSPHDPNVLYTCGNIAYRSTNGGHSWQAISPDLTRADMRKLGARTLTIGSADADVSLGSELGEVARSVLDLPFGQIVALGRSLAKGLNPDRPENLDAVVVL